MRRSKAIGSIFIFAERYVKTLEAQTTPPKPESEEKPLEEKLEAPENKALPETQQPLLPPQPIQQHLPFYPEWKQKSIRCQYPRCNNKIDPTDANTFRDYDTGIMYCSAHIQECASCGNKDVRDDMTDVETEDRNGNTIPYYVCGNCLDDYYSRCPNCKKFVSKDDILLPTATNRWRMKQGGCEKCSVKCSSCNRVVDKDENRRENNENYCDTCWSEYYTMCDECSETITQDDSRYVGDQTLCESCYNDNYTTCVECAEEVEKSEAHEIGDDTYCESCYEKKMGPTQYKEYTDNFSEFSYTKKDRYLSLLYKLLPISAKELKSKHPSIANGLTELIAFAKGGKITNELVKEYRNSLNPEEFPVGYTVWHGIQRSVEKSNSPNKDKPQLVINVLASDQMMEKLTDHTIITENHRGNPLYSLFDTINDLSKQSTHPYVKDQIGWIRVELAPNPEPLTSYLLVDEVQSDHSHAAFKIKNGRGHDMEQIRFSLQRKYKLDDEELNKLLIEYAQIVKDFPNIAAQAVLRFARKNGFKKIYWHTYEGGKRLKNNEPPKSLYERTPKENFYLPSQEKPFGLDEEFFEREARKSILLYKIAARYLNGL